MCSLCINSISIIGDRNEAPGNLAGRPVMESRLAPPSSGAPLRLWSKPDHTTEHGSCVIGVKAVAEYCKGDQTSTTRSCQVVDSSGAYRMVDARVESQFQVPQLP
ncbi:hypothetical protein E2C01_037121 [Portunus trituberculatus]|uniref:Uncharacterized protein n=1 Tax=Portunus trituberculatus TaxID=210409 RepID=A0A5B7FEG3_PORTR|nr:hypothetical protein [Portunus trituberculatus]